MEQGSQGRSLILPLAQVLLVAATAGVAGCAEVPLSTRPAALPEVEGRQLVSTFEGTSPRDAIVRVVSHGNIACTGTLIADDRVLTAHHCISARDERGKVVARNMAPSDVIVELGREDFPWAEVRVRAVVAPQCGFVDGDGDIAILVLERHLIGMPTVPVRINAPPKLNDALHVHGYGRCALPTSPGCIRDEGDGAGPRHSAELCTQAIHLRSRESDNVDSVAPGHFTANAEICPGDSGGPVYGSSEDLIGVVSAAVMDGVESTRGHSVFTRLDVWAPLFSAAEEISNGASPSELPPFGDCHAASAAKPVEAPRKRAW